MDNRKTIYCPRCNRKIGSWDGKSTISNEYLCKKCKKLIVYEAKTDDLKICFVPQRNTSSGKRFYWGAIWLIATMGKI